MVGGTFVRKYWAVLAILALVALGMLGAVGLAQARAQRVNSGGADGAQAEVVYAQPVKAVHAAGASLVSPLAQTPGSILQPRLDLPSDFFNFGAVSASAVVRKSFLVINRGAAPLVIEQAYTTCGCATAELTATRIPPGKASRVTVIFDAGYHPVAGQTVRRGLVLLTNDPLRPEVEIWVQADVGK